MMPVKICGITNLNDALICVENGVTAVGFVLTDSKRKVTAAVVYEISRKLPSFVTKVGVFTDEDPLVVRDIVRDCGLDLAQLHGAETTQVAELLPWRVIKSFKAGLEKPGLPQVLQWRDAPLRAVLIDSYSPTAAGGTGQTFDWELFRDYRVLGFPLILAGGLNPENISAAIQQARPDAVDLSSGVEQRPGIKDAAKVRTLMGQVRRLTDRVQDNSTI